MKINTTPTELGTANINRLLKQYAIPSIIAMTSASLYNITDSIFIGHGVGSAAISGLAITFPLMNLAAAFGSLVGLGGATLLSIRIGQKDYQSAKLILGNVLILNVIIGALFSICALLFLDPILFFFGASNQTIVHARDYMIVILAGNVFTHIYVGMNMMLRSSGHPQKAMLSIISTVLINAVLNPLFIFGFGWGIRGSAIATILSQMIMLCWQLRFFSNKDNFIHIEKRIFKLKRKIAADLLSIGLSPFCMNTAACLVVIVINQDLTKYGGDVAVGAFGIVNRVIFLFVMTVIGLNQGMQPIAGYNFGAKQYDRVIGVLKRTIMLATIVTTTGFVVIELFPHAVASAFTSDEEYVAHAVRGLRTVFLVYPLVGFQVVVTNFFQSIGMSGKSIFLSLSRQLIFFLPLLVVLPRFFDLNGVWYSFPISDTVAFIISATMFLIQMKKFKQSQEPRAKNQDCLTDNSSLDS